MGAPFFIAKKIRFKGKLAAVSIALSFVVMIIAVSVASGYRQELLNGLRNVGGDIRISSRTGDFMDGSVPLSSEQPWLDAVASLPEVKKISPVVYRAGVVTHNELIHGVMFKGVGGLDASYNAGSHSAADNAADNAADSAADNAADSLSDKGDLSYSGVYVQSNTVSVPRRLSEMLSLSVGDKLSSYFIGERTKVRNFTVGSIYDSVLDSEDKLVVYANIADLQRVNGWNIGEVSAFEVLLGDKYLNDRDMEEITTHIGTIAYATSTDDDDAVVAASSRSLYPQVFDWLNLIDFNVNVILILMTIVAGFNMISGLLILLFENISTIGLLKAVGMDTKSIAGVFLWCSSALVLRGMVVGNALAMLLCLIQSKLHLIKLDPQNYFLSFVPIKLDIPMILSADFIAFAVIMLMLVVPCAFISKVDPAKTMRVE